MVMWYNVKVRIWKALDIVNLVEGVNKVEFKGKKHEASAVWAETLRNDSTLFFLLMC